MKVPVVGTAWSRIFLTNPDRRGVVRYVKKVDFLLGKVITVAGPPGTREWTNCWRYHCLKSWANKYKSVEQGKGGKE